MAIYKINKTTLEFGNIYYVSSSGNDTTGDGSESSPFKNFTKAYDSCVDGDAIIIMSGTNANDYTSGIEKSISIIGEDITSKITGESGFFASSSGSNISLYRLRLSASEFFRSSSCEKIKFYNCYITVGLALINYNSAADEVYFNNCIIEGGSSYGVYRDDANCTNCIFINNCKHWAGYGDVILNTCLINDTFYETTPTTEEVTTIKSITSYTTYSFDSEYNISGITWENIGTGTNPDGSIANIGLYGGEFGLGEWPEIRYLIYNDSLYKIYDEANGWVENTNISTIPPTEQDYLDYGMGDLSIIQDNINLLNGQVKLYYYIDKQDITTKFLENTIFNKDKIITSDNISLNDTDSISSIILTTNLILSSDLKISISPDDGKKWYSFKNNEWVLINNIKTEGNTIVEFNSINENLLDILSPEDKKFKIQFYLSQSSEISSDVNKLDLTLNLRGGWTKIKTFEFKYMSNNDLKINILSPGTYKINY